MRYALPLSLMLLVQAAPTLAQAPELTEAEAAMAARMVDAACIDFANLSGGCTQVVLLTSDTLEDMADLLFVPSGGDAAPFIARDFVFHGAFQGQDARLEPSEDGGLLVHAQQSAYGRHPWFETLEVAHVDGAFAVIGYSYSTYDRPSGGDFTCEVDLRSGAWRAQGMRVDPETGNTTDEFEVSEVGHADTTEVLWWSFREPPAHCDALIERWFNGAF